MKQKATEIKYPISFVSRYGDKRTITKIGENEFSISGESSFYRAGTNPDTGVLEYADFEGGPFVAVGGKWWELGGVIESVSIPAEENKGDGVLTVFVKTKENAK